MPRGAPKTKQQRADDRRAARATRFHNRKCLQCGSRRGMGEPPKDTLTRESPYCPRCQQIRKAARDRYAAANPGYRTRPRTRPPRPRRGMTDEARNARRREIRWGAKLSGWCTKAGCQEPPLEDHLMCEKHRDQDRRLSRDWHRRKSWPSILGRNIWRAASAPLRDRGTGRIRWEIRAALRRVTETLRIVVTSNGTGVTIRYESRDPSPSKSPISQAA